ncbi:hypothetical protein A5827_002239, partial [Enterococcus faecium]
PRRLIVKDNRNSIRKEVLHLIKFVKKTVAIPENSLPVNVSLFLHFFD